MSRLLFEKSSKGFLKENIIDEKDDQEISDQNDEPENEKATTRHTHATPFHTKKKYLSKERKLINALITVSSVLHNNDDGVIVLGPKWIRDKQESDKHSSIIFVLSMPPRFSKKNDY